MISNILRVALRNFLRQRFYSFINIIGLASGLVCTLFIFLWVGDEIQKDGFHKDSEKIYQIVSNLQMGEGNIVTWSVTPGPLGDDIKDNVPEAELMVRTMDHGGQLFQYEEKSFVEAGLYADPEFFKMFSFKIINGYVDPPKLDKSWVAISKKLATKLFGTDDAIGKSIKVASKHDVKVIAVFEDVTSKSSIQFDYILPFELERQNRGDGYNWGDYDYPLYVKLTNGKTAEDIITKINTRKTKIEELKEVSFYILPFSDYYLNSHFENGKPAGGRVQYVKIFSIVAVFILIIACINFMNMSTAKAATRLKEVGVRKVVGAQRFSLIIQFISESLLISLFAMVLALGIVYSTLPLFNVLVSKRIVMDFGNPLFLLALIAIVLITGLLAGSYPAFFLSGYKPASVLKGSLPSFLSGGSLRKALVVFQFSLTVILIAGAIVIYNQLSYILNKNVGYNRDSILSFSAQGTISKNFDGFRNEVMQIPGVKLIAKANSSLVQVNNQNGSVKWPGKKDTDQQLFRTVVVDYDFLELMNLKLKQGRLFSRNFVDTASFVVTQRAVDAMGLADPIGQKISQWGNDGVIVGVVDDFHSRSMHDAIDPIVFMFRPDWTWRVFVKLEDNQQAQTIGALNALYKKYSPEYPFEYAFVDDDFEKLYKNEKVTSSLALGFTFMAILISCLGLLGLASYTTERKRKEISIRKTLGASVSTLVAGMSKEFIWLSLLAAVIGCPISYYLMSEFLSDYAYHTELSWGIFVITAIAALSVTLLTVIFQVTRAAVANPVEALRNE